MKRVKIKDIADMAGVSTATVSRVLNNSGYASEDVKEEVLKAAEQLGYEIPSEGKERKSRVNNKSLHARRERSADHENKGFIGVVLKQLPVNAFFDTMNAAIIKAALGRGQLVSSIFCEHVNNETLAVNAKRLLEQGAQGLIVTGFEEGKLDEELKEYLLNCGKQVIFVERLADSQGLNRVSVDNTLGGYLCGQHLVKQGHKKIIYIERRFLDDYVGGGRMGGFMKAIEEAEVAPQCHVEYCDSPDPEDAYQAMKRAVEKMPDFDAVQAWYDGYLIGIMRYLYEIGKKVPDDVEVVGHDDTYAPMMIPPVSSVHMPFDKIAAIAVNIILEGQGDEADPVVRSVNMEPRLIVR